MASARGRAFGVQVFGYAPEDLRQKRRIAERITRGGLEEFGAVPGVVLGARLMENLGLSVGDSLTLIAPEGRSTVVGMVPRIKSYPVLAAFSLGQHALDAGLIVMPIEEAKLYFTIPQEPEGSASAVEVDTRSAAEAGAVAEALRQRFATHHLRVYDWLQSNAGVFSALAIQRNVMVVILALIILVAVFNIISSLVMLVQDKTGDIAILRTMGASRAVILRIFLLSGMSIGALGTALGLLLGLLAAARIEALRLLVERLTGQEILVGDIYFLSSLPTRTDPWEVAWIVLLALGLSFLATLYPAWKASGIPPAEALKYE
jgi:lipoprotein-releasing system permease protein